MTRFRQWMAHYIARSTTHPSPFDRDSLFLS